RASPLFTTNGEVRWLKSSTIYFNSSVLNL
ncbi:MAG: hypothetical protein ACJAVX_003550, partial [Pseudoalteromonas rhizosphaerae]